MGPIQDHAREKLLPTDRAIMMARRMLYEAATAMESGTEPPALDSNKQRVRAAGVLLDRGAKPQEWAKDASRRRTEPAGLFDLKRLDGKVALITGGGGGIGAATARLFCAEGAAVMLVDLNPDALARTALEIARDVTGARVETSIADIADAPQAAQVVARTLDAFACLDLLVNNAAMRNYSAVADATPAEWQAVLGVNLDGGRQLRQGGTPGPASQRSREHRERILVLCPHRKKRDGALRCDQGRAARLDPHAGFRGEQPWRARERRLPRFYPHRLPHRESHRRRR